MGTDRSNCAWYLPRPSRRVIVVVLVIFAVILTIALTCGYGEAILAALVMALVRAAATESVKAVLRRRPRNA